MRQCLRKVNRPRPSHRRAHGRSEAPVAKCCAGCFEMQRLMSTRCRISDAPFLSTGGNASEFETSTSASGEREIGLRRHRPLGAQCRSPCCFCDTSGKDIIWLQIRRVGKSVSLPVRTNLVLDALFALPLEKSFGALADAFVWIFSRVAVLHSPPLWGLTRKVVL